jgi:hypothetical protein
MRPRRREVSVAESIERLVPLVESYESRYGLSSQDAVGAVQAGTLADSPEIARWLSTYRDLEKLREAIDAGSETGIPTRNI